ncbi:hypothetical protein CLAIMM_08824 [Cladophialophora immunda]|nr:hypothetical protein CLAIMM_08824 [Cladophialophora immunda]
MARSLSLVRITRHNKPNHKADIPAYEGRYYPRAETIRVWSSMLEKLFWCWAANGSLSTQPFPRMYP